MPASRARRASSGPASASASTLTITTCLPCAQHASAWRMPAAGLPVASMTISISGAPISASGVVGDERRAGSCRLRERARAESLARPARARERRLRSIGREVGDRDDVNAGRVLRLREVHRAELAGADQPDAKGTAFGGARQQHSMEIHRRLRACQCSASARPSGTNTTASTLPISTIDATLPGSC